MAETFSFSRDDARRYYNRFGAKQDSQGFYEDPALEKLAAHSDLASARAVLEIGCGTGKFAERLLARHLPETARYIGLDISETMVGLATRRLRPWADRAEIRHSDGGFDLAALGGPFDRVIATYVLDLLSDDDIARALRAAHARCRPGGLLCLTSLSQGAGPLSRVTSGVWNWVHGLKPSLVGGCRPLSLAEFVTAPAWRIRHREIVVSVTVPSEVLVAEAV